MAVEGGQLREAYVTAWGRKQAQWTAEAKQLEADVTQEQKRVDYWQGTFLVH